MAITLNGTTGITTPALDSSGPLTSLGIDDNATSTAITIDASNNVGIGTSSPAFKLDVAGSAHATSLTTSGTPSGSFGASKWFTQQEGVGISRTYFCGPDASTRSTWEIYNATSTGAPRLAAGFTPTYTYFNIPSGTTTALVIDSAGRVTMPYQPHFHAFGPAYTETYTGSPITNVLANIAYNVGNHYNATTGKFTVPVAGAYLFTFGFFPTSAATCRIELKVNGTAITNPYISGQSSSTASGYPEPSGSQILRLNVNDYVNI